MQTEVLERQQKVVCEKKGISCDMSKTGNKLIRVFFAKGVGVLVLTIEYQ